MTALYERKFFEVTNNAKVLRKKSAVNIVKLWAQICTVQLNEAEEAKDSSEWFLMPAYDSRRLATIRLPFVSFY
jgi:hypothetical protein